MINQWEGTRRCQRLQLLTAVANCSRMCEQECVCAEYVRGETYGMCDHAKSYVPRSVLSQRMQIGMCNAMLHGMCCMCALMHRVCANAFMPEKVYFAVTPPLVCAAPYMEVCASRQRTRTYCTYAPHIRCTATAHIPNAHTGHICTRACPAHTPTRRCRNECGVRFL